MKMWGVIQTGGKLIAAFVHGDDADKYAAKWDDANRPQVSEIDVKDVDVVVRSKMSLEQ